MVPLIQTEPSVMELYPMIENSIQYILIKKCNNSEYFYGPFKKASDAWNWANSELQNSKISNSILEIKQIYVPYCQQT